jgi:hypothetical protein
MILKQRITTKEAALRVFNAIYCGKIKPARSPPIPPEKALDSCLFMNFLYNKHKERGTFIFFFATKGVYSLRGELFTGV